MTHADYIDAIARILELSARDPGPDEDGWVELETLVGETIAYEREHYPEMFVSRCPWCGQEGLGFAESEKPVDYCHHEVPFVLDEQEPRQ